MNAELRVMDSPNKPDPDRGICFQRTRATGAAFAGLLSVLNVQISLGANRSHWAAAVNPGRGFLFVVSGP